MPARPPTAISAASRSPTAASRGSAPISSTRSRPPCPDGGAAGIDPAPKLYGRRRGRRLRPGMARLLAEALPPRRIDLTGNGPIDPSAFFEPPVDDVWLEIGFGAGEHLAAQAAANPRVGLIGCEPFLNGVAHLLARLEAEGLGNVRLLPDDARPLIERLRPASLGRVFILFPDPWHKARHHKRRLVARPTLDRLAQAMRPGSELRVATDDPDYLRWILAVLTAHPAFAWRARRPRDWDRRPPDWPESRYESKAVAQGLKPAYLRFERRAASGANP